ncbi:DUF1934 domain-containing protein [Heliorestis acidaminivorans]|uniref:DUF1934 domain-containing protein n=1 Tax=Heliorestis acidaminivorans TaxID=553427 RepID=A0A6I0ET79_9FIRM|nr:DUF1934 domain-containing protein [Heliorestis acidaminivorans]KAB2953835.1 DUF1934 domain-containing protein [Heliorestis acidaminivorans]
MKKSVLVSVLGTQKNEFGEIDRIELLTPGTFFIRDGSYYIVYKETEITGMEGTTTTVKAEPHLVTLNRMGTQDLKQTFEEQVPNASLYVTPYGSMNLTVIPSKVQVSISDEGGIIDLAYELQVDQRKISDNTLTLQITVKEARK